MTPGLENHTTIAIIEDHGIARAGAELLLENTPGLRVVAAVATIGECAELGDRPGVVILDLAACHPADLGQAVRDLAERSAVLVISRYPDGRDLAAAFQAGALGLVTRDIEPADFVAAVRAAARGSLHVAPGIAVSLAAALRQGPAAGGAGLSGREVQALRLLADGYTHRQIGRRMGVAETTVNTYVKRIRAKLHAGNKAELTRLAIDLGYADFQ
jgi:DNA-binding NarL/FixJ family response regulator